MTVAPASMDKDHHALHLDALAKLEAADHSQLQDVHRMEQVTQDWLNEVLGKTHPEARLIRIEEAYGHEGMTIRHNLKLTWNEEGQKNGLPTGVFIKITPENSHLLEMLSMLSMLHMAELECRFYNSCAKDSGNLVPTCYYARSHPGGRFVILLEDLAARGTKGHWMGDTCSIE